MEGHCVTATWEALHKVCGAKPTDIETALVGAFFEAMGKATPTTKPIKKPALPAALGLAAVAAAKWREGCSPARSKNRAHSRAGIQRAVG